MTLRPELTTAAPEPAGPARGAVAGDAVAGDAGGNADDAVTTVQTDADAVRIPPRPARAPRRRAPKLDELLAAAVDEARSALTSVTGLAGEDQVGAHAGAVADDDRLVTHRFAAALPGYGGWEWFATLSRAPRSKAVTVCEVGLLPGRDAILAPDWVPWSDRVSQEEKVRLDAIAAGEDPEKALARFRDGNDPEPAQEEVAQENGTSQDDEAVQDRADRQAAADVTDEATDGVDVDAGSDAADADVDDESGSDASDADAREGIGADETAGNGLDS